ncbi:MAG TPA: flagellar motor switch protein FliN [Gemmatimonadales bacterium]|jgi:flagellar motor switch protein FliN/FliY
MSDSAPGASRDAGPAELAELGHDPAMPSGARLDTLLDMMLPVTIEFGRTAMSIQDVLNLGPGSVVQLQRLVGEPVDIYVSERRLAEGEVVVIGDAFAVRVTRILNLPREQSPNASGR